MSEEEWLTSRNWSYLHDCLDELRIENERKFRLVACASCRRISFLLSDDRCKRAVLAAEQFADGMIVEADLASSHYAARQVAEELTANDDWMFNRQLVRLVSASWNVLWATRHRDVDAHFCATLHHRAMAANAEQFFEWTAELSHQHDIPFLRDIFGNPFRTVSIAEAWLSWNDRTIPRIAQAIYDERKFEDMPVLADALEEAGCTDTEILGHCRGPGPHAKGCWVVDAVLGKG